MGNLFKASLLAAAVIAPTSAAFAQDSDKTGFYASVNAGVATVSDVDVTYYDVGGTFGGAGAQDTASARFDLKSAFTVGGTLGYDFGAVRTDIEVSYARNRLNNLTLRSINGGAVPALSAADRQDICDYLEATSCGGSGATFSVPGSRVRQLNALANVWVDLPIGPVTPYAGGGVGVAGFEVEGEGKARFAWQLGAGAALRLSDQIELTADYRHREVNKFTIEWDAVSGTQVGKLKTDSFTAGLRFRF
jgi:opacity protein-like surface antigen